MADIKYTDFNLSVLLARQHAISHGTLRHPCRCPGTTSHAQPASQYNATGHRPARLVLNTLNADQQGAIAYTPYGSREPEKGGLCRLGCNGEHPEPATGIYLLGNGYRAYNPLLMRFHSPDSWAPFGRGGINEYAYCLGDPINHTDPTGHMPQWSRIIMGIGVSIGIGILSGGVGSVVGKAISLGLTAKKAALAIGGTLNMISLGTGAIDHRAAQVTSIVTAIGGGLLLGGAMKAPTALHGRNDSSLRQLRQLVRGYMAQAESVQRVQEMARGTPKIPTLAKMAFSKLDVQKQIEVKAKYHTAFFRSDTSFKHYNDNLFLQKFDSSTEQLELLNKIRNGQLSGHGLENLSPDLQRAIRLG